MYVVDASVWVSRLIPSDAHHEQSRLWLQEQIHQNDILASPALTLAEIAGAISRRTGLPEIAIRAVSSLQQMLNVRIVTIDDELAQLGARLAAELRVREADAIYIALAQRLDIPLVTWDIEQLERGERVTHTLSP